MVNREGNEDHAARVTASATAHGNGEDQESLPQPPGVPPPLSRGSRRRWGAIGWALYAAVVVLVLWGVQAGKARYGITVGTADFMGSARPMNVELPLRSTGYKGWAAFALAALACGWALVAALVANRDHEHANAAAARALVFAVIAVLGGTIVLLQPLRVDCRVRVDEIGPPMAEAVHARAVGRYLAPGSAAIDPAGVRHSVEQVSPDGVASARLLSSSKAAECPIYAQGRATEVWNAMNLGATWLIVLGVGTAIAAIWLLIASLLGSKHPTAEASDADRRAAAASPDEEEAFNTEHRLAVAFILLGLAGTLLAWRWPSSSPTRSALAYKENDPVFFPSAILLTLGVVIELVVLASQKTTAAVRQSASKKLVIVASWLTFLSTIYVVNRWSG